MEIPLTQRLSFKQAGLTVLVAFILGTLLSLVQIGVDYASEDATINREIRALMDISHNPAARIAYNIDAELAQELVAGLQRSPAVIGARIVDSNGEALASTTQPPAQSNYRIFSDFLFGDSRHFETRLSVAHAPDEQLGVLQLDIDTYAFGSNFLKRSVLTLVNGFTRSLLLSVILLVLFYFMLTKPLIQVIQALSSRDRRTPDRTRLPCPPGHERDEIGVLVNVANRQFASIASEIEQRRNAEDRLTDYLGELEAIVSARTVEIKAANSRLSRSNEELEKARHDALAMAQARSIFLANMSHEIRTPLNGLLGMLALSLEGPLSSEQRQQLSIAHDSGKVLVDLLNDILDLSKFEAGQLELESIAFDLGTLVEGTASLLSQNALPGVELTCLIDPQLPAQVLGDPTRVRQIVSNLLSNALKFTREGRVDIRISAAANRVLIEVCDTGIGIAEDAQARIFQPFTQAGADIARQFGGTGLGLALTRRLCEAMHGQLELVSTPGSGSRFTATLPLPSLLAAPTPPRLTGRVLAICDADTGLAELLPVLVGSWGLDYQRLDSAQQASDIDTDVLISDCPTCMARLRQHTATPIILVTAYGSFLDAEQAGSLAPLEQVARPLTRQHLLQALGRALQQPSENASGPLAQAAPPHKQARVLLVEDNPVNQLVAKGMLSKQGLEVTLANNGEQALERLQEEHVDLVLMDCNMPVMDGYEASRRIRANQAWRHLPIIALTANALSEERERCLAAGMNDYLAKPFRREELLGLLDKWLPA
ncbi:hybrid sensor histidine kinase/response regulator [Pseudomonas daroniae]|uniref:histidine kinase n=1 Tax=Phytopseudomonas daroniae TaxID=2487519 RepID=A0A4Q9QLP3_9GAMM|nr:MULTISPECIES: response regulator [Pseudomonas]TBU79264.1 hybrid sensor histidine kinase/response regulator [Pseudomonas daroniae]TBU80046.1 hybrid sensor histidine kinase/response regulator [Pseudomonas sp. FRB 228]TBU91364.1 hybrid sensor histidine kinase/response regulator [Pseudomonas daroniae]